MFLSKNISLFLSIFLPSAFSSGCTQPESESVNEEPGKNPIEEVFVEEEAPDDFNFILNYGTYGKQKVDTFEDIVVKDLVEEGTAEAAIYLSDAEMRQIYNEMMRIGIMQISELDPEENQNCVTEPPTVSEWTVQMKNETNRFSFYVCIEQSEVVTELVELETLIHDIVSSREEYKELPVSVGGYE